MKWDELAIWALVPRTNICFLPPEILLGIVILLLRMVHI